MKIATYIKRYRHAKKCGAIEEAAELRRKIEKGARGLIAERTSGKRVCAALAAGDNELVARFKRMDDPEESKLLSNKYNTYLAFRPYYKREAMLVHADADAEAFAEFCTRHGTFFIKPLSQFGGHGVRRLSVGQDGSVEEFFRILRSCGTVIVEEPILQAPEMARFHPQSINNVRVVTARIDREIEIVQSSVRMGTGCSVVDNGCLSAGVDPRSGTILTPGRSAHGSGLYERHPDTGEQIVGATLPDWHALLTQVREQTARFHRQRIVGWDMAYSTDGWVIVEANSHPAIQILAGEGVGMRDVFERITRSVSPTDEH